MSNVVYSSVPAKVQGTTGDKPDSSAMSTDNSEEILRQKVSRRRDLSCRQTSNSKEGKVRNNLELSEHLQNCKELASHIFIF